MNRLSPSIRLRYAGVIGLIVLAAILIGLMYGAAEAGGPDDGLLLLAGATALLRGDTYPILQRPPLYSGLLAVIASMQGVDRTQAQPLARELGNIVSLDVLSDLLEADFLRAVLIVNLILWSLTVLMVVLILDTLKVSWRGIYIGVILMFIPSSWRAVGLVSETPLSALLIAAGLYALIQSLLGRRSEWMKLAAGSLFALVGITHATFQLLAPVLLILLLVILYRRTTPAIIVRRAVLFILPFAVIVGGWSLHNYNTHGVAGVSGSTGVALSTRTARIVERAADVYPEEAAVFVRLRDETYLTEPNKDDMVYWGARASNWLMSERNLSYVDANRLLLRYNLAAIRCGPLTYMDAVLTSLVGFHFPGTDGRWSTLPRLMWAAIEFGVMVAFVGGVILWGAAYVLAQLGLFPAHWRPIDTALAFALLIFAYTALVSCAVDVGKPEQRFAVQFIVPLVIVLAAQIRGLKGDENITN